ncbi:MAG: sulfur carrier protein ThiS [Armatimonadota bacterium]|nr:sulfur carrier protein ThiS [Armatimonadota bacterium]
MRVYVNGEETEVAEQLTVATLLAEKGVNPNTVVVEHNLVILPREEWSRFALTGGDKVEIVTFMGGG